MHFLGCTDPAETIVMQAIIAEQIRQSDIRDENLAIRIINHLAKALKGK